MYMHIIMCYVYYPTYVCSVVGSIGEDVHFQGFSCFRLRKYITHVTNVLEICHLYSSFCSPLNRDLKSALLPRRKWSVICIPRLVFSLSSGFKFLSASETTVFLCNQIFLFIFSHVINIFAHIILWQNIIRSIFPYAVFLK